MNGCANEVLPTFLIHSDYRVVSCRILLWFHIGICIETGSTIVATACFGAIPEHELTSTQHKTVATNLHRWVHSDGRCGLLACAPEHQPVNCSTK